MQSADIIIFLPISPTSNGAAAAVLASEEFVKRHKLQPQSVEILAQVMATDYPSTFEENSCMKMVGLQCCIPWYSSVLGFLITASLNDTVDISMSVSKQIILCGK